MELYESTTPLNAFGSQVEHKAIGAPPGTSMEQQMAELLRDLPQQLSLPGVGISTPWAGRTGDMEWKEISQPDTNVQTFLIRDEDLRNVDQVLFGQPIPFLVIKTLDPVTRAKLESALLGSAYEMFETQAVYRQDDPNPVPRIEFFNWVRRVPLEEEGSKSMQQVAAEAGGDLLYGQQVPVEGTTSREPPAISFQQAFDQQFLAPTEPMPADVPAEDPEPGQQAPVPRSPAQMPFWGPLLVAGAVATATVVLARGARR